ncbi:MAG: mandelate racemase/muconate lactonizing enzyme family protein [Dehalococcoidia bacterium]
MKIIQIETFIVDAGWRPWAFVAIRTDEGITGYGECSDPRNPYGIKGAVTDFEPILNGRDPGPVEAIYWDMYRLARQSPGGTAAKAIAGIELALWDIKGKALGVPVHQLFGGPVRDRQRVYWSHCGTSRARSYEMLGTPPLHSMGDIRRLGEEVRNKGFTALKTNIIFPGRPANTYFPGFGGSGSSTDQNVTPELLRHIEMQIRTFKEGAGPDVEIALDLNFNFKPQAAARICKVLEQFDMMWVEIDMYEPDALRQLKDSTSVTITSGENLIGLREYRPYFNARSMDVVKIDIPWNGFSQSRQVALLAESHELNIAPHNYYSHLSTMIALNLCATVPNVRIMEIDVDDVPWKDELTSGEMIYEDGTVAIPDKPGWGVDLDEAVARSHVWEPGRGPGYTSTPAQTR